MNARLKLVGTGILLCLALGLTIFCSVETIQAFQKFQQDHKLAVSGDVSTISSWMTVPYIARFYHVPESYLDTSLHITNEQSVHHIPLRALADRFKRPVDSLIHDIQHAILNYRKQRPRGNRVSLCQNAGNQSCQGGGKRRIARAGASPAPTLRRDDGACEASQTDRVGAGLAPALVVSPRKCALPPGLVPALVRAPTSIVRKKA